MLTLDAQQVIRQLTQFIKASVTGAGFSRAVIAVSGGVDSATSYLLAVRALGVENVYPVLLPYGPLGVQGTADARRVIQTANARDNHVRQVDIQPIVDAFLALDPAMDQVRKGNVMARVRMILLYDQARRRDALVVGTENKSEHWLGYFTRFGDEASDVEPLRQLYKTQVYQLARAIGVPEPILTKSPTAGLWEGQTDEGEFGFSYAEADEILALMFDEGKSADEIVAAGCERAKVEAVTAWVKRNEFKHHLPLMPAEV